MSDLFYFAECHFKVSAVSHIESEKQVLTIDSKLSVVLVSGKKIKIEIKEKSNLDYILKFLSAYGFDKQSIGSIESMRKVKADAARATFAKEDAELAAVTKKPTR